MPHLRTRILEEKIQMDLTWSPVVSVLGMRQVGKSTLLKQIGESYFTLDQEEVLLQLQRGEWSKMESAKTPVVIDEAQKSPGLFDRVKWIVDQRKRPGQYLLTGSVRFLSRKQIRESLTGRTSLLELLPLTLAESHSRPSFDFIRYIQDQNERPSHILKFLSDREAFSSNEVRNYLKVGGMPGICFKRDSKIQARMREAHLETLLMRDLQLLIQTKVPYVKLRSILSGLAQMQPQSSSISALARQVQLSTPTVIQMIQAFENLFIIRSLGKHWYFTDVGMGSFLGADRIENPLFHMERFIYQEIYAQLNYEHRSEFELDSYSTRGGVRIPFVIRTKNEQVIAIMLDSSDGASEKSLKSLNAFEKYKKNPVGKIVLHQGKSAYLASTGAFCLPYTWVV